MSEGLRVATMGWTVATTAQELAAPAGTTYRAMAVASTQAQLSEEHRLRLAAGKNTTRAKAGVAQASVVVAAAGPAAEAAGMAAEAAGRI